MAADRQLKETYALRAEKRRLEAAIIQGTAVGTAVDRYVAVQLELAKRPALEFCLDPRD